MELRMEMNEYMIQRRAYMMSWFNSDYTQKNMYRCKIKTMYASIKVSTTYNLEPISTTFYASKEQRTIVIQTLCKFCSLHFLDSSHVLIETMNLKINIHILNNRFSPFLFLWGGLRYNDTIPGYWIKKEKEKRNRVKRLKAQWHTTLWADVKAQSPLDQKSYTLTDG